MDGKPIAGAGIWTKQNFEESLGKREDLGLKMVIDEKPKVSNYRSPKDKSQDRVILAVTVKGSADGVAEKAALLRRSGYPVATVTLDKNANLSGYMQFMHYVVFGLGYLRQMNFITQPSVELYKAITSRVHADESQADWKAMLASPMQMKWRGGVTLFYDKATDSFLCPSTQARNALYTEAARTMFPEIAKNALAASGFAPEQLTHLITVSCTGFFQPGPDFAILKALGLHANVERYHLGFMGCYAAFPALRMARAFCHSGRGSQDYVHGASTRRETVRGTRRQ